MYRRLNFQTDGELFDEDMKHWFFVFIIIHDVKLNSKRLILCSSLIFWIFSNVLNTTKYDLNNCCPYSWASNNWKLLLVLQSVHGQMNDVLWTNSQAQSWVLWRIALTSHAQNFTALTDAQAILFVDNAMGYSASQHIFITLISKLHCIKQQS